MESLVPSTHSAQAPVPRRLAHTSISDRHASGGLQPYGARSLNSADLRACLLINHVIWEYLIHCRRW